MFSNKLAFQYIENSFHDPILVTHYPDNSVVIIHGNTKDNIINNMKNEEDSNNNDNNDYDNNDYDTSKLNRSQLMLLKQITKSASTNVKSTEHSSFNE